MNKLILLFALGGLVFSGVYHLSVTLKNPALAAILSLIPLSIIATIVLPDKKTCTSYLKNAVIVIFINFIVLLFMLSLLFNTNYDFKLLIFIGLFMWAIVQYSKYTLFNIYYPEFQKTK